MAGRLLIATTNEIALVAATQKTVLQLRVPSASQKTPIEVLEWGVYFDGVSVTAEPIVVNLVTQDNDGSGTAITFNGGRYQQANLDHTGTPVTPNTTAHEDFSTQPTGTYHILDAVEVHPQQGYEKIYPLGQERRIPPGTTTNRHRIAIACTAPANVNVRAKLVFVE